VIESVSTGPDALFKSKGDARRMIQQGGVYINGRRLGPEREQLSGDDLLAGRYVLVRKGARSYALVEIVGARS
jgi:tyrosyl-tRNA synthetase